MASKSLSNWSSLSSEQGQVEGTVAIEHKDFWSCCSLSRQRFSWIKATLAWSAGSTSCAGQGGIGQIRDTDLVGMVLFSLVLAKVASTGRIGAAG